MEVWDPKDKTTVLSQIKSFIAGSQRALTRWLVCLCPGNLVFRVKDRFYAFCEIRGSKISNWAWHKRWNKRNKRK